MVSLIKFLLRRAIFMLLSLCLITVLIYGALVTLVPARARAVPYLPNSGARSEIEDMLNYLDGIIEDHGMDDPFLVQYGRWVEGLFHGDWGYSPAMRDEVLSILLGRTPATAELVLFSLLLFIPLGLVSGVVAGWKRGRLVDRGCRLVAFVATSIPPFVLGLMLLAVFYVNLHWFVPGRMSTASKVVVSSDAFRTITHLLIVDGVLNGRLDIALDALRHLILPAFALSLAHWATLTRITRVAMVEELDQEYIMTARGKGLSMRQAVWRHALRNAILPGLNSCALSAAALITGTFVIEIIFGFPGISVPLTRASHDMYPDVALAMGFAVYSILLVLPLMFILDILQAVVDPRIRQGGDL